MKLGDKIEVTNEDCMELMARYPDNHFDLAIVDPPYGIDMGNKMNSVTGGIKHTAKDWDKHTPSQEYWDELFRVSKDQIVWGGNYFMSKIKKDSACWIFWDKNNGDSLFADGELAWTSFETPVRIAKIHWCGSAAKWETGQNKIHPTQKPVKLYEWLLVNYAKPNDKILDTHCGSASIAIALDNVNKIEGLNLSLTACELDRDYYEASIKRIQGQIGQMKIGF